MLSTIGKAIRNCPDDFTTLDRFLLVVLEDARGDNGIFPSVETLARRTGASRRAVFRSLERLKESGLVTVHHRYDQGRKGRQTTSVYVIHPERFIEREDVDPSEVPTAPGGTVPEEPEDTLVDATPAPAAPRRNRRQPETPIPDDWKPTEAHRRLADERGVSLQYEAEQFRLHALAHDRRLVRWDAGFSQWLRKAQPRAATGRPVAPNPYRHFKDFTNYDRHSEDD